MPSSRREFLVGCSAAIAAMAGGRLTSLAWADPDQPVANGELLVVVFLRGGMDGLNLLGPADDADYVAARPDLLRVGTSGPYAGLPLEGGPGSFDFRLNKVAAPLKELYDSGLLAFIHACGLTDGTRSHFEAMDMMERGILQGPQKSAASGWLGRYLNGVGAGGLLPAMSGNRGLPNSLMGFGSAVSVPDPGQFHFIGAAEQLKVLRDLYGSGEHPLHSAGLATLTAVDLVQGKVPRDGSGQAVPYKAENNAAYPDGEFANALKSVAQLVKMDLGLHAATVDFGGWDTHEGQSYLFPLLATQLSKGLAAFYADLHRYHDRLTVVVMSEFGRRLKANLSTGTDHGHGNVMMALGKNVAGGRIYGNWPGLATEQLDNRADLAVTTDYRTVLAELLTKRLSTPDVSGILPDLKPAAPLGVFRPRPA